MAYQRQTWVDYPDRSTPITAERLNHMEAGIEEGNVVRYSNPNLLDNPFFTVNQRGQNRYSGGGAYCVDRWYRNPDANVELVTKGIIVSVGAESNSTMFQRIEKNIWGKTITISAITENGLQYATATIPNTAPSTNIVIAATSNIYLQYVTSISQWLFALRPTPPFIVGNTVNIQAVKLELGSVSTLSNDVAPNYAEELAKCQRYFQRIKLSRALCMIRNQDGCKLWVPISLPTSMRVKTPSISNAKINAWVYHSGTSWDSNVSINSATVMVDGDESHIAVDVALTNPLTNYTNGSLGCCASFEADLSADL